MIEIVFLGTGSAVPTQHRNLSGTALLRQGEIFLFDCGEGTQIQFRRAHLRPGKLTRIFISHFHGDHLFGLPGLLTSLQMSDIRQTVHLYGPEGLRGYIEFHRRLSRFTLHYPLEIHEVPDGAAEMQWDEGEYRILCRPLVHRLRCLGWAVIEAPRPGKFDAAMAERLGVPAGPFRGRLQAGESVRLPGGAPVSPAQVIGPPRRGLHIAYCVDTSPTAAVVELARGADLLIHDATFAAEEAPRAHETGHATVRQAAEAARAAGVRKLALTHLSGRYPQQEDARLLRQAREIFSETILAQDLARLRLDYPD